MWAKLIAAVVAVAAMVGLGYYQFGPRAAMPSLAPMADAATPSATPSPTATATVTEQPTPSPTLAQTRPPTPRPTPQPTPRATVDVFAQARSAYVAFGAKWKSTIDAANAQLDAAYGLAEMTAAYGKFHQVFVGYRSDFIGLPYPSACEGQRNYVVSSLTTEVQALLDASLAPDSMTLIGLILNVNSADEVKGIAQQQYKVCIGITS